MNIRQQVQGIMQFFKYEHLPVHLQEISKPFCVLAYQLFLPVGVGEDSEDNLGLDCNLQLLRALEHLLEAKDCAVRAKLYDSMYEG